MNHTINPVLSSGQPNRDAPSGAIAYGDTRTLPAGAMPDLAELLGLTGRWPDLPHPAPTHSMVGQFYTDPPYSEAPGRAPLRFMLEQHLQVMREQFQAVHRRLDARD